MKCSDCSFWNGISEDGWRTWGVCGFEHYKLFAFVPNSENGRAELRTTCDFGCVHFNAKTSDSASAVLEAVK